MKDKKHNIYFLFALVLGIWGYVIYVVFSKFSDHDPLPISNKGVVEVRSNLDTYRWKEDLTYDDILSDDFFQEISSTDNKPDEQADQDEEQILPMETYDPLAYAPALDIQYLGFIENLNMNKKVALVQITGKQHYLKTKQSIDGYTILSIYPHEIKVRTNSQTVTISKQ
ncbi:hypothetical protein SMI01S_23470 [Sphingobacterium mizutaii NBRC 14946 = DSM 11724]|uniref:Uncharacterized protein n=2 Tax=Sphingobacterium mizutaii TaxID=1010 RepID=A0AAJ5BYS7_9SPHI|nr:hypothetical protein [Sphingobacterium mizutaii]GEM68741.1 hypothetical protein SMI01S_23470 [Sphingobacterium mizutaii NBRC 14946 = DSM 11724]SDL85355.1 hypothetical protein SAMN05192578_11243 [Sphingobacterium mizutaii]SNV36943.1 Uncharacterised protein [Sphingobacterium mizutaii]